MFHIRTMLDADLAEVVCIEQQNQSPWSSIAILDELKQEMGMILVAEVYNPLANEQRLAGWCACRHLVPEAELMKIAVRENLRKLGVASSLLSSLCNFLSDKRVETLLLEVRSENTIALNFYKKNGFLQIGQRAGYYTDPIDDALLLQKRL